MRVIGATSSTESFFGIDQDGSVIVLQLDMPKVHLTQSYGLSDHNGMACIDTANGTSHGDDFGFAVVAVDQPRIISPKDCDEACASKLTGGSAIPDVLNGKRPR